MKLYLLGTGGAGNPVGRAQNCFLVESNSCRLLLDFGEGCSSRLESLGLTFKDIDALYISHIHYDHWAGIPNEALYSYLTSCDKLRIITHERIATDLSNLILPLLPREFRSRVEFMGINHEFTLNDLKIELIPSKHSVLTYGVVVKSKEIILYYTSDTEPAPTIHSVANRADIVLHEATIPSNSVNEARRTRHSTVKEALEVSKFMRKGSLLVLIHLTRESEKEIFRNKELLGKHSEIRILIPNDMTLISL